MTGFNLLADRILRWLYFGLVALAAVWAMAPSAGRLAATREFFLGSGHDHQGGCLRDAWDIKGPLAYFFTHWHSGCSIHLWGIRLLDLLFWRLQQPSWVGWSGLSDSVIARGMLDLHSVVRVGFF